MRPVCPTFSAVLFLLLAFSLLPTNCLAEPSAESSTEPTAGSSAAVGLDKLESIRVATYNVAMYRNQLGELGDELATGNSKQAKQIAEVIQRVRPDIVLINEFDYEEDSTRLPDSFRKLYLEKGQNGQELIRYPHIYYQPVNTGVDSGEDLDRDGKLGGPADAHGYGRYPGQYGMLLLSRFPIDDKQSHTFQKVLWKDLPGHKLPVVPSTRESYYPAELEKKLRLSSKSFWDVCVEVQQGDSTQSIHLLCSHPTPPGFDGPEDRNGRRNHDEIGLIARYLDGNAKSWGLKDDNGLLCQGISADQRCIVLGDLNADPVDGGAKPAAINQLLNHDRLQGDFTPSSEGGIAAAAKYRKLNAEQKGNASHDTANFSKDGFGNMRADYAIPSNGFEIVDGGIFWPKPGEAGAEAVSGSDHRLVWIDLAVEK